MITLDFETRSRCDLRKCGASVYAQDPSTEILCLAWEVEYGYGGLWTPGDPTPPELINRILWDKELVEAHNAFFERRIWHYICHKKFGWPDIPFEQWRCSLAACSRLTFPRGLGPAGQAIGVDVEKDEVGRKIMMRLAKPKKPSKSDPSEWDNDPDKFQRLYRYCEQDVKSEMAISHAIDELPPSELKVWQLDQRINLRGLGIDVKAVQDAISIVESVQSECCRELSEVTNGEITGPKQVARITAYVKEHQGEEIKSLSKDVVAEWLERDDLDPKVRRLLELRRAASQASTGKLQAMLDRCDPDGRVRGSFVYHGAATGRWAGAGIQPQNFTRGSLGEADIELAHELLPFQDAELLNMFFPGSPMETVSSLLRSMIKADEGKRFLISDFSSIEARVLAWLAGQEDLLSQFRADEPIYENMASRIYEVDVMDVTKTQRQVGKTAILGLGYGMGHRTFRVDCRVKAGVTIDSKMARKVVKTYRDANDKIPELWKSLSSACIRAIETQQPHRVGRLEITADDQWLKIKLPSGRSLHYNKPSIGEVIAPWSDGYTGEIIAPVEMEDELDGKGIDLGERKNDRWVECQVPKKARAWLFVKSAVRKELKYSLEKKEPQYIKQIQFWGVCGPQRKWKQDRTYGGKLVENVTQAVARDFMCEAMLRVEKKGYPVVLTVHDEVGAEVDRDFGSIGDFDRIMKQIPTWGKGCPIDAKGFESTRYKKD